jgi:hypothetical protein
MAFNFSVVTPCEQYEPVYLPEGVALYFGILQHVVPSVFSDFSEWMITIFDNLLIMAHSYEDAYCKCDLFLDRCVKRNVKLKFSKTWIGFDTVKFFGYLCMHHSYDTLPERVEDIMKIAFTANAKKMLSSG